MSVIFHSDGNSKKHSLIRGFVRFDRKGIHRQNAKSAKKSKRNRASTAPSPQHSLDLPLRSESVIRRAGCVNRARPDLWGAWVRNHPGLPDYEIVVGNKELWPSQGLPGPPSAFHRHGFIPSAFRKINPTTETQRTRRKASRKTQKRHEGRSVNFAFSSLCCFSVSFVSPW